MHCFIFLCFALTASAVRPFINKAPTGIDLFFGSSVPKGTLPNLTDLWSIPDFEWAARNFLNDTAYAWIRYGTGAEYTYKNNLEIFPRVGFKPRVLTGGKTEVNMSMQ